jgi:hypothetical protein
MDEESMGVWEYGSMGVWEWIKKRPSRMERNGPRLHYKDALYTAGKFFARFEFSYFFCLDLNGCAGLWITAITRCAF